MKTENVTVATTRGPYEVPAYRVGGTEFVIWRYKDAPKVSGFNGQFGWSVTHAKTGRAIVPHARTKKAAIEAATELTNLLANWDFTDVKDAPKHAKDDVRAIQIKASRYAP